MTARRLRAFVPLAALAVLATACGSSTDTASTGGASAPAASASFAPGTTMAKLAQAGTVRVGTKFDQPLFGVKGLDGKLQGFDVRIAKIIAAELGIPEGKVEFVEAPSKLREELIEQDKVDYVVATYTINDKRKERISFAGPYYQAGQDIMVRDNNTTITGPDSLRGNGKVCSVTGSTPSETVKQYINPDQLVLFDVYSKCADALRTGQVDAVTTDNVILLGLVDQSNGAFKLVGEPFTKEPYGVGIEKGNTQFCQFINDTLREAAKDGRYAQAWKETAGKVTEDVPELPELDSCS